MGQTCFHVHLPVCPLFRSASYRWRFKAEGLEYTVNYGIFTVFSKPLYWLLAKIHGVVGNWGWAIVILTILIKAAFFKLTEAQYRSTARMRKLQPRIELVLQEPEEFRVVSNIVVTPDKDDDSQIVCKFDLLRWYAPL